MHKILLLTYLLLGFALAGFSQVRETPNANTKNTDNKIQTNKLFTVSGLVSAKSSLNLLSNATVKFQKYTTNPLELMNNQIQTVKTDESGRWTFKNLPAGEYKIVAAPPEFSNAEKPGEKISRQKLAAVTRIIKIADQDIRDFNIELPVESTVSGSITVKSKNQNPDFDFIIATDEKRGIVSGSPVKNKTFRIENLSEGNYFLNLTVDEDFHVQSIKLGNEDITNSTINLTDGENVKNVQIIVSDEVGIIKGKIDGFEPDKGILIVLLPFKYSTAQNMLRSSLPEVPEDTGEFEIKAPTGEYFVAVITPENMATRDKDNLEGWFREITQNAQKVAVLSNQTTNVRLKLPK